MDNKEKKKYWTDVAAGRIKLEDKTKSKKECDGKRKR